MYEDESKLERVLDEQSPHLESLMVGREDVNISSASNSIERYSRTAGEPDETLATSLSAIEQ